MSRSRLNSEIKKGSNSTNGKEWRRRANKRFRRMVQEMLNRGYGMLPQTMKEVSNIYDCPSGDKWYFGNQPDKEIYKRK